MWYLLSWVIDSKKAAYGLKRLNLCGRSPVKK